VSDLVFNVVVDAPEINVSVVEPVVAALVVEGPPGPQGLPGAAASNGYVFTQTTPAATWIATHTLGRYPLSSEITIAGEVVHTDITYPDVFTAVVVFASPQSGTIRLT